MEHRRRLAQDVYANLSGVGVGVDVIVLTPEDIDAQRNRVGSIVGPALDEGRVVWAAARGGLTAGDSPRRPRCPCGDLRRPPVAPAPRRRRPCRAGRAARIAALPQSKRPFELRYLERFAMLVPGTGVNTSRTWS